MTQSGSVYTLGEAAEREGRVRRSGRASGKESALDAFAQGTHQASACTPSPSIPPEPSGSAGLLLTAGPAKEEIDNPPPLPALGVQTPGVPSGASGAWRLRANPAGRRVGGRRERPVLCSADSRGEAPQAARARAS